MVLLFYLTLLQAVGTFFYYCKNREWGGYGEISSHANFHARVQFVLLLLVGVITYALPAWAIKIGVGELTKIRVGELTKIGVGDVLLYVCVLKCYS